MTINKPSSEIGSRNIASLINEELRQKNITDKNGKLLSITKSTILFGNVYLKIKKIGDYQQIKNHFIFEKENGNKV